MIITVDTLPKPSNDPVAIRSHINPKVVMQAIELRRKGDLHGAVQLLEQARGGPIHTNIHTHA